MTRNSRLIPYQKHKSKPWETLHCGGKLKTRVVASCGRQWVSPRVEGLWLTVDGVDETIPEIWSTVFTNMAWFNLLTLNLVKVPSWFESPTYLNINRIIENTCTCEPREDPLRGSWFFLPLKKIHIQENLC